MLVTSVLSMALVALVASGAIVDVQPTADTMYVRMAAVATGIRLETLPRRHCGNTRFTGNVAASYPEYAGTPRPGRSTNIAEICQPV